MWSNEPYNTWPGAYGSVSRIYCDTIQSGTPEWNYFQSYLATAAGKGRYAHLPKGDPKPPSPRIICPDGKQGELTFTNGNVTDPNSQLWNSITKLNFKRIGALLRASPKFDSFNYFLVALGKHCDQDEVYPYEYFGYDYARKNRVREYGKVSTDIIDQERALFAKLLVEFNSFNTGSRLNPLRRPINGLDPADDDGYSDWKYMLPVAAQLQMVAERMGLDATSWSPAFISRGTAMIALVFNGLPSVFWDQFANAPALADVAKLSCDELKRASVVALSIQ